MIGWPLWFFVAPHLFLLDGFLAANLPVRPDLGIALCLVLALHVRTAALPGLLLIAALGRSLLQDGDLAVHFLAMGLPVAALLPMRAVFLKRSSLWHCTAAGLLAVTIPKVGAFFAQISHQAAAETPVGLGSVLIAMATVPLVAWGLRALPPLSLFVEASD